MIVTIPDPTTILKAICVLSGGALGNVSDYEGRLLQSALGALDMVQSPENFQEQLRKINGSITRWNAAVQKYGYTSGMVTAPTGEQIILTD